MRTRDKTRRLALCALLSALGVVLLYLGSLIEILDLSLAAVAPLLVIYVAIELGGYWPWLVYLVTGFLSLLLLPNKFGAVVYLLFSGFYPMVKQWAEKRFPRGLAFLLKLILFQLSLGAAYLLMRLFVGELSLGVSLYVAVVFLEVTFLLYDFVLTRMITLYVYRWRKRFKWK